MYKQAGHFSKICYDIVRIRRVLQEMQEAANSTVFERVTMSNIFAIFGKIADQKIREAMEEGEFDDLPGKGKPLNLEDDSHLPQDLRLAYKILKNADCLPPELELRKEIHTLESLLSGIQDTQEKYKQMKKLNFLLMKLNMTRKGNMMLEQNQCYYERVLDKMKVDKGKDAT
jgi:hypothetical protein